MDRTRVRLRLPDGHRGLARARAFTRDTLAGRQYRGDHDDVVLVVSELVSNALLHGDGIPVLSLAVTAWRVRVEVTDGSAALPAVRPSGADGGWGLRLVERMSAAWGAAPRGAGKVVWCEVGARLVPVPTRQRDTVA